MKIDHKHIAHREPRGKVRKPIVSTEDTIVLLKPRGVVFRVADPEVIGLPGIAPASAFEDAEPFDEFTGPMGALRRADA